MRRSTLLCAGRQIEVEQEILDMALARCDWRPFLAGGSAALAIRRVSSISADVAYPLEGSLAPWGSYAVEGDVLLAHIPDDPFAAESVLRVAYQIVSMHQGGILLHGAGVAFADRGVAAVGPSGAGKSTLASLCVLAGGRLLTDEVVQLFPDGSAFGTPFRSNAENVGSPGGVKLRSLLLLRKGTTERVEVLESAKALPALMGQLFRPVPGGISPAEAFRRLGTVVDCVGVRELTFRRDPAVGGFLKDWLSRADG